jgi:PAS domain-containing protein
MIAVGRFGRFPLFLAISAVLIGGVAVSSGVLVGRFFEASALLHEEQHTAQVVQNQARQHLAPTVFASPTTAADAADFQTFMDGLPRVFRVKAFDPAGRIVWSNEPRLIGLTFPDNPYVAQAMTGRVVTILEQPGRREHIFERSKRHVSEVYVPIRMTEGAGVAGVVETYVDMTDRMADVLATQRRLWAVSGGLGALLYLALAVVVWQASVNERRAVAQLAAQNRDLRLLQQFTNSLLIPTDLQGLATSTVSSAGEALGLAQAALYRVGPDHEVTLLAAWPDRHPRAAVARDVVATALETGRAVVRDRAVVLPISIPEGADHVFAAEFPRAVTDADAPTVRTLGIMLSEAAIMLANVALFTKIREAHERLAAILAGVADHMHIVDRGMRVVWMNSAALDRTVTPGVGVSCFEAFGMTADACHGCPALRTFETGHVERGVRTQHLPGGEVRHVDLVTAPLRDDTGAVHQVLEVARDITELVEMEERLKQSATRLEESHREVLAKAEELERANHALRQAQARLVKKERLAAAGEMVVGLHHAILNPLTGILGALHVIKQEQAVRPETQAAISAAEDETRKIEQLVRRLGSLRQAAGTTYVGATTMLDLERACDDEGAQGPR